MERLKSLVLLPKDGEELPELHELVRMAGAKAKQIEGVRDFIHVKTIHFIPECRCFVALYEAPALLSDSPMLGKGKVK